MNALRLLITAALATTLIACEETPDTSLQDGITESFYAKFDPSNGVIPFPNNLLFDGNNDGITDETLEIPIPAFDATCNNLGEIAVKTALSDMDGFSTTAPISTNFSAAIDSSSLIAGSTVRVFEVTLDGSGNVDAVLSELAATDYAVSTSTVDNQIQNVECDTEELGANKLVISPLKPLKPKTKYAVAITNGVKNTTGDNAAAELIYSFTKNKTPLVSTFPPASLADVIYPGLKADVDPNDDDVIDVDVNGDSIIDAADYTVVLTKLAGLEKLRILNSATETALDDYTIANDLSSERADLDDSDIVLSWVFTTQSVGDVLTAVRTNVIGGAVPTTGLVDSGTDSPLTGVVGYTGADIFAGTLETTYYLHVPATAATDDAAANSLTSGSWQGGGNPVTWLNTTVDGVPHTIPLMVSIPKSTKPPTGWPVVIFQHGITGNRTNMLGLVDTMANAGFAVVAIDLPLHGLTGCEVSAVSGYKTSIERTFDVNYKDNATEVTPDPDNCIQVTDGTDIDPSGTHFVNLESILTSRDNVRQAVADLFVLTKSLEGMSASGDDFDTSRIHFVGHSLGAIVGGVFLAIEDTVKASVLGMPGGGIAKLLDGSATFGPIMQAGLAANGVNKGYAQYEGFLASAQMALDSGDPINYTTDVVAGREILLFEVVGNGSSNLADQVIPNNVISVTGTVNAPLSGTDPLVSLMSLTQIDTSSTYTANTDTLVKFSGGHHSSLLTTDLADGTANTDITSVEYKAYVEMQSELATFIASDGASLTATDASVVSAVAP